MNYETTIDADGALALNGLNEDRDSERAGRRRLWIIAAVVIAVLIGAWYAMHNGGATSADATGEAQAQVVSVIVPGQTTIANVISASGTIAARREMPVGVAGEGGQVARVLVDAGDWVQAGQVLAVIDRAVQTQQLASQAANVEVAAADARLAQANLDRALKLVERGFISKADVDRLTATRDAAVARVGVARAGLGELRERTARLNIVAPAAGLVLTRAAEPGQIVSPGTGVLFSMARDGQMEMQARLSEFDLARLSVGSSAEVIPVGSERTFSGEIWQLSPTIDQNSREGIARIALPYDKALRPGGFASAKLRSGTVTAPLLPESAILSDEKGSFVYVVGSDDKVERRAVKTGEVNARGIAVIEGLSGKERIVLRAGGFLNAGDKVQPVVAK
ncbi:MAG: efflux transporter periplasmic adaptor subunit [Novosphingobium sp. 28-62-57]|uniref:efflux RND transporter periplasmic adaptor subunit n=1 Tax=unclassified Novosphingobium TaxID=2644732 RepID=UPI000BDD80A8|nr:MULTISPECIES: efflux RND transporter periplasmic adaptor subunit [unclassified Novosphingobium]OYW50171.1 MAG: efflux transporter periplasmic adaptor subunit [Novosphingobium sp. 12-62-10]OYZ11724.1 MAG: efflux transporter periplasmic adaptor subunit [Novosphingobium sp. 28-62-57]HQS69938.1 efflux RND transporter periplasmic adaptor subunit [Novosphingobium sp.]